MLHAMDVGLGAGCLSLDCSLQPSSSSKVLVLAVATLM